MKTDKIAICVLLLAQFSLSACGRKEPPSPEDDALVTYNGNFPSSEVDEVTTCPETKRKKLRTRQCEPR